ncbi:hypothetical protein F5Y15DRAFT_264541 [Xylariaceae sp. FL0016]|nr:hypothetical protein F5Y15DRAFT_264541 [Xylariaceae sp. FL0016]
MPNAGAAVGVVAVSIAVAAAIAIYESPELQRMANDLRRRIAIALHQFGDRISPQERENLFNRPEDAEGFLRSRGIDLNGEGIVDADEETRQRQREELIYWNAIRESKKEQEITDLEKTGEARPRSGTRGSSFDDFLREDESGEKGTYIFQSGHESQHNDGLLRRRGDGARGLNYSVYTNPFGDEHGIDETVAFENSLVEPEKNEVMSDIYSATDLGRDEPAMIAAALPPVPPVEVEEPAIKQEDEQHEEPRTPTLDRELDANEYMTAGQDRPQDAYSSIQAWAQNTSNPSFYSPLPVSPAAPISEPELISNGQLTPTDSASLAGSGEDIGDEARSAISGSQGRYYDVMSDDEGIMTPASWTEVGSVVSESENDAIHA